MKISKNNIKKRFILVLMFATFLLSSVTFALILNYLDPYSYKVIAGSTMTLSFILGVSSFMCLFLYFIKKIYFRSKVYIDHVISSFRQGFLIALFLLLLVIFKMLGAALVMSGFFLFAFFVFIELFIQNQNS